MATKTLTQLRSSVRVLYGDPQGVTATDAEVDALLADGVDRVISDCPWLTVTLDATETLTTDAVGGASFDTDFNIQQLYQVEIQQSDSTWVRVGSVHKGRINHDNEDITTVDSIVGYSLDGARITFWPRYASANVTVRVLFSSDSIGSAFPTVAGDKLPAQFGRNVEEAAIRHAVAQLHMRDNNLEAAQFINGDVENWILKVKIVHNRTEPGEPLTIYNTDEYSLDS